MLVQQQAVRGDARSCQVCFSRFERFRQAAGITEITASRNVRGAKMAGMLK